MQNCRNNTTNDNVSADCVCLDILICGEGKFLFPQLFVVVVNTAAVSPGLPVPDGFANTTSDKDGQL